jgi:ABC-type uncharacterized transport system substrate-binding protein
VERANERSDFLLLSDYHALVRSPTDDTLVPPQEVIHWTLTHSNVPIMGTTHSFVAEGGYLAIGASPFEQGEVAATMAINIINQEIPPQSMPIAVARQFVVFMRGNLMKEIGVFLPWIYESFARATNNYFD